MAFFQRYYLVILLLILDAALAALAYLAFMHWAGSWLIELGLL
ncbi:MAG: hypothetical protein ACREDZ_02795 [Kiloniellales bacterium]